MVIPRTLGPLASLSPTIRATPPSRPRAATSGIGIGWQKQLEVINILDVFQIISYSVSKIVDWHLFSCGNY